MRRALCAALLAATIAACGRTPGPHGTLASRRDILLVTLDTVRADALGFAGNARVSTPNLDALAREGRVFTNAHAHNVVTLPSHVNILTGLYPFRHGVRDNAGPPLSPAAPTVATLLSAAGYATGAFVGAFPLDARWGLAHGFDVYDDRYGKGKQTLEFVVAERRASEVVKVALGWYERQDVRPRFLWVHLYDAHAPYAPPPPFDEDYKDQPYLGEIASVDAALGPLLSMARERGAFIAVTADHGEALGDHGEETHGLFAYEATLKVPLVLHGPGITPGIDGRPARHVDLLPTLLAAAGAPTAPGLDGVSLLAPAAPDARTYFEALSASLNRGWAPLRGVLSSGVKYVDLPLTELYDLPSDPREERNLAPSDPRARALAREIPQAAYEETARTAPSAEATAKLRSLGYVSGSAPARRSYGAEDDPKRLVALDALLHHVIDLYQKGRLDESIAASRELVARRPQMAVGYEHLAFLLQQKGRPAEAVATLRAAAARGVASESMTTQLAMVLCEAGRPAEALKVLRPYSTSRDPDTLNALGIAASDAGRREQAIAAFRHALDFDPTNVPAHQNLGIAYLKADDAARARTELEAAVAANDGLSTAWNALGVARARLGDTDGALAAWRKAYDAEPSFLDALLNYGLLASRTGRTAEARTALGDLLARSRDPEQRHQAEAALRGLGAAR